jgi:hypothetical protein
MALKNYIVVRLGVIYDSQASNRKQGTPGEGPSPPTPLIGCLGVIYDSQPSRIHTNSTRNRWKLLVLNTQKEHHKQVEALTF